MLLNLPDYTHVPNVAWDISCSCSSMTRGAGKWSLDLEDILFPHLHSALLLSEDIIYLILIKWLERPLQEQYLYMLVCNSVRWACLISLPPKRKKVSIIQYGYRNRELIQECFPKHSRMGTARFK